MPTTFYLSNGSVQTEPKPNVFVNPAAWTLQTANSYSGAGDEGRLEATNAGSVSHRDMNSPATIGYYRMTRHYSKPLAAQTILAQTITAIMSGFEDLATANAEWAVQIFVWKADDTGVRGPILYLPTQFTEMAVDAETETSASGTSTELVVLDGDKLCVEVYYYKTAAKAEALSRHHYGPADVSTYTSRIVFTNDVALITLDITVTTRANAKAAITPQLIFNLQKSVGTNAKAITSLGWNSNLNVSAQSLAVANAVLSRTTVLSLITYVNAKALVVVEVLIGAIEIVVTASANTKALALLSWSLNVPATSKVNSKSNVVSSWNTSLILKANAVTRALTTPIWNAKIWFDAKTLASALAGLGLSYSINVVARSRAIASVVITAPVNIYVVAAALAKMPIQVNVGYQIVKRADAVVYLEPTVEMVEAIVTTRYLTELLKEYKKKSVSFQA